MKKKFINYKGFITIAYLIVGIIVMLLIISTKTVVLNSHRVIQSNGDAIRANYLAESAIEKVLAQLIEETDELINRYLDDLKNYKINYLKEREENITKQYLPPDFNNYLNIYLTTNINRFNIEEREPFNDYTDTHMYRAMVNYDMQNKLLFIEGMGIYNNSRKLIKVKSEVPFIKIVGEDAYTLPKIEIHSWNVIAYHNEVIL